MCGAREWLGVCSKKEESNKRGACVQGLELYVRPCHRDRSLFPGCPSWLLGTNQKVIVLDLGSKSEVTEICSVAVTALTLFQTVDAEK